MKQLLSTIFTVTVMIAAQVVTAPGVSQAQSKVAAASSGDFITPGDNLVIEGIPPIPTSLVKSVSSYTNYSTASLSAWHPLKREMLISIRYGDTMQTYNVETPNGDRTPLNVSLKRVHSIYYPPKKGSYLIYSQDSDGNEFEQFYRYDLATGTTTLLTDGKSRNIYPMWSNRGDRVIYGSNRRNSKDSDLYVINPLDPRSNRMLAQLEGGNWVALDWSPDDRRALVYQHVSKNETYLWLFDVATGERTLLTPKEEGEAVAYGFAVFSRNGKGIYMTTDREAEFQRLAYFDLTTRRYKHLTTHIKADVEEIKLSPDGRTLAFIANEEGVGRLHLLDTRTAEEQLVGQVPVGLISELRWHSNNRDLGFVLTSARHPSEVYSLDVMTRKVERWTRGEMSGMSADGIAEAELVRWKSFDGRIISGFLYRPPRKWSGKRPIVIDIHGGPESQFRPGFAGAYNYFLNELGVALLYPNVRGSSGYGKTFLKLDNKLLREDSYKDIGTLLDWIRTQPAFDADRVMVSGESYGGHMALVTAVNYGERIRAGMSVAGPANLATFLENTENWRRDIRRAEYGDERDPKMRAFLEPVMNYEPSLRQTA